MIFAATVTFCCPGAKYAEMPLGHKRIFGVFRAQVTCLVAEISSSPWGC